MARTMPHPSYAAGGGVIGPMNSLTVPEFVEFLVSEGLSPKTVVTYRWALQDAFSWCERAGLELERLSPTEIARYATSLPRRRSSLQLARSALGWYWRACGRPGTPEKAIRVPTHPRMVCRALSEPEAVLLASSARARNDLPGLATLLGLYAGLRRAEIAAIRFDDVDDDGNLSLVGKGGVSATLPLHPVVLEQIAAERRDSSWPYLFPGSIDGHVHPTTVWCWVRQVASEAGLSPVSTHVLRHTALAVANDATGDLRAVQAFARHAKPETTAGYTRATQARLLAVATAIGDSYAC